MWWTILFGTRWQAQGFMSEMTLERREFHVKPAGEERVEITVTVEMDSTVDLGKTSMKFGAVAYHRSK